MAVDLRPDAVHIDALAGDLIEFPISVQRPAGTDLDITGATVTAEVLNRSTRTSLSPAVTFTVTKAVGAITLSLDAAAMAAGSWVWELIVTFEGDRQRWAAGDFTLHKAGTWTSGADVVHTLVLGSDNSVTIDSATTLTEAQVDAKIAAQASTVSTEIDTDIATHKAEPTPHTAYDDMSSLTLLFENSLV